MFRYAAVWAARFMIVETFLAGLPATAQDVHISNPEALMAALSAARGGERLLLAPGDYGQISIRDVGNDWQSPVTIMAEDPANPPVFRKVDIRRADNLTLDRVVFDYMFRDGDKHHLSAVSIRESNSIAITNAVFDGDNARGTGTPSDGVATARGITVTASSAVSIKQSIFQTWFRAGVFSDSDNLRIIGNEICDSRSEGLNFADVQNLTIEGNYIHDFRTATGSDDHPDMIQFWTNGTKQPSENIEIRDNLLDQGAGAWTQSIFMRNEEVDKGRAGKEMYYRNIKITGNVIRNAHLHGITVGESDGLLIANNTLVQTAAEIGGKTVKRPSVGVALTSKTVTISSNITPRLRFKTGGIPAEWQISGNYEVQGEIPSRKSHYRHVFVQHEAAGLDLFRGMKILPKSEAAVRGAGAKIDENWAAAKFHRHENSTRKCRTQ